MVYLGYGFQVSNSLNPVPIKHDLTAPKPGQTLLINCNFTPLCVCVCVCVVLLFTVRVTFGWVSFCFGSEAGVVYPASGLC